MAQPLVVWEKARLALLEKGQPISRCELVSLPASRGRVLAQDVQAEGKTVLPSGSRLGISAIAAGALAGLVDLRVFARPGVSLFSCSSALGVLPALAAWCEAEGGRVEPPLKSVGKDPTSALAQAATNSDLVIFCGAEEISPPAGASLIFAGVDMEPGGDCRAWSLPEGGLLLAIPGDLWGAFVGFQVLCAPALRGLGGERGPLDSFRAPLRFSKAWPEKVRRWYPGRHHRDPGVAAVEHLAAGPGGLAGVDCLFTVPATEWIRDGDVVTWIGVRGGQ